MNTHGIKLIAFICLVYYAELESLHVYFLGLLWRAALLN